MLLSKAPSTSEDIKSISDVKNSSIKAFSNIVDPEKDPQYYVDRYNNEPVYQDWFDKNYFQYSSIYQAVGLNNLANSTDQNEVDSIKCRFGTERVGDMCVVLKIQEKPWWQFW